MPRLAKRNKKLIVDVVSRWARTMAGAVPESAERVQKILDPVYRRTKVSRVFKHKSKKKNKNATWVWKTYKLSPPKLHIVHSPLAFRIAEGVLRGYLSKIAAKEMCAAYGINDGFINNLRREAVLHTRNDPHWYRSSSALAEAWEKTLEKPIRGAIAAVFSENSDDVQTSAMRRRRRRENENELEKHRALFADAFGDLPPVSRNVILRNLENSNVFNVTQSKHQRSQRFGDVVTLGNFWQRDDSGTKASARLADIPNSSRARTATHCRVDASGIDSSWGTNYIDAEVLCTGMQFTRPDFTWQRELVHAASMVMTFRTQALVLLGRPTVHCNQDGELHNDEGPAVVYPDGAKQYWVDGHQLGMLGEKIVDKPETLTLADIQREQNEEVKRIAIEVYGWSRYLEEIGARIVDSRENDVDNTIEALVEIDDTLETTGWANGRVVRENTPFKRRKLVLACRSTARQYFLAVPEDINTCEEGQRWLHAGASTDVVELMNYPVRLLGAS
jgi:hypothetical protein